MKTKNRVPVWSFMAPRASPGGVVAHLVHAMQQAAPDYADAKGLALAGDFFTETLCRFPHLLTGSGEVLFRICAPVEYVTPPLDAVSS